MKGLSKKEKDWKDYEDRLTFWRKRSTEKLLYYVPIVQGKAYNAVKQVLKERGISLDDGLPTEPE